MIDGQDETRQRKSPLKFTLSGLATNNPGGFLLSHAVARAVPSAPRGLTSVFGNNYLLPPSSERSSKRLMRRCISLAICFTSVMSLSLR